MRQYLLLIAFSVLLLGWTVGTRINAQTTAYARGQDVSPTFDGWQQNPDGTYTFYFGYFNRNTEEELDVPPIEVSRRTSTRRANGGCSRSSCPATGPKIAGSCGR